MIQKQFLIISIAVASAAIGFATLLATRAAVSAPIQPDSLSGLTYWVKADAGVTESEGFVSQWNDQSASGINVANTTGTASQPNLVSVTNGSQTFNAIRFDTDTGETDVLSVTGVTYPATNATGGTVFAVQIFKTAGTDNYTFSFGTSNSNKFVTGGSPGGNIYSGVRVGNSAATYFTNSSVAPAVDTVYVSSSSWGAAPSSTTQSILLPDGSYSTTSNGAVAAGGSWASTASVFFGQLLGATVNVSSVDVAEVIIYDHQLDSSELAGVSEYLGSKYGVLASNSSPGDFNGDGLVNGADFAVWQSSFPTSTGAQLAGGDADGDGDVDGADFVVWQTHYSASSVPATTAVPEPNSLLLVALGGLAATLFRRRWSGRCIN